MFQTCGIKVKRAKIVNNGHHLILVAFTDLYGKVTANKFNGMWIVESQEKFRVPGIVINYAEMDSIGKKAEKKCTVSFDRNFCSLMEASAI
jgi:hypothetical protein